jgi:DNA-binding transcriptional regulator LsrR (DeoR family)
MRLADRIGAQCYPLPTPVVTETTAERDLLQSQRPYQVVRTLAEQARVTFLGVGRMDANAPLLADGFITTEEFDELARAGAVGEVTGQAFDSEGRLIESEVSSRITAIPVERPPTRLTIGIAGGQAKTAAITGALRGRLVTGLITDEVVARAVLASD